MPLRASSHPGSSNSPSCSALAWCSCWPGLSPSGESWKRTRSHGSADTLPLRQLHKGATFCVLTVQWHWRPLSRLHAAVATLQLSIKMRAGPWLVGYSAQVLNIITCVMDTRFLRIYSTFFMPANEWMYPIYDRRICKYLFCIHAKFDKHTSSTYYKPDAQSLKFCCKYQYGIFSQFRIQGFQKLKADWTHPLLVKSL